MVGWAIDCKLIVGKAIIGGTIDGKSIISGAIVGVAIVGEAIVGGDGAVLAGRGGKQRRITGACRAGMSWAGNTMIWRRSLAFLAAAMS